MKRLPRGVYAVTDGGPHLAEKVTAALHGGAVLVQYRDKSANNEKRLHEARALRALCEHHGVPFIVNDDVALALASGADGVHLGKEDADYREARSLLGPDAILGLSCYNDPLRAKRAAELGADYVAFGSFFPSTTKPNAVRASPELLTWAKEHLKLPVVAIGGITPENGIPLMAAGADLLAVLSGIFSSPDVVAATARYARLFISDTEEAEGQRTSRRNRH